MSDSVTEPLSEGCPATLAFADLSASVLWCISCQQAQPARLQDETYHCTGCGTAVGTKTTTANEVPPLASAADDLDEVVI